MSELANYAKGIHDLFKDARQKSFAKNQLIQYAGDQLTDIFLIQKGYVKNYTILDSGDTRTLFILGPGDIFPVAFSSTMDWDNYTLKYFYQSMTEVKALAMPASELKKLIDTNPKKKDTYMAYVSASNEAILSQLEAMKQKKAIARIVYMLPYLMRKLGQRIGPTAYQLRIKLTHQELADLSGVTRETTTTLLKRLVKRGAIEQKKGKMIIHEDKLDEEDK